MKSVDFEGIWIPKEIMLDKQLSLQEKNFLALIASLDNENGCYASNAYFAEMFNITTRRSSEIIGELNKKGYISLALIYKPNSKEIEKRVLKVNDTKYRTKVQEGIEENSGTPRSNVREGIEENSVYPIEEKFQEIIKSTYNKDYNKEDKVNYQFIIDNYNNTCVSLPKLTKLSDARRKAIRARLNTYSIEDFKKLFEMAEASDFLKGANNRNWSASFDWLVKDSNMAKVLDGNYANTKGDKNGNNTREEEPYISDFTKSMLEHARKTNNGIIADVEYDF